MCGSSPLSTRKFPLSGFEMFCSQFATIAVIFGLVTFTLSFDYTGGDELYEDDPCKLGDGSAGICTVSGKCAWFVTNVIQKRLVPYRTVVRCGFNRNDEIICCPSASLGSRISRKASQACEHFRDSTKLSFLIVGGEEAEEGDVPFIAALGYESSGGGSEEYEWGCGSSLISPRFLLTAGHCIRQARRPIIARMGILNLVKPELDSLQESTLKRFLPHPDYKPPSKYNDIALIEVDKPFKYDDYVNAACLYTSVEDLSPSQVLVASGWGLTEAETRSEVLLKVNLTTEPLKQCDQEYRTQIGTQSSKLANGVIATQYCTIGARIESGSAAGKRRDSCNGDSGGPLHFLDERVSRFFLVGVTSFGLGCGETASIYTRVAAYLDWIEPIVWPDSASLMGGGGS
uniref:Putative trypsin-like serine protease n=2 Tax=Culex tarsalis TaxID=7177 RepID=A0A1Q3EYM8_CULTA